MSSSPPPRPTPLSQRLSLVGLLTFAAGAELVLNRMGAQLVSDAPQLSMSWRHGIDLAGLFAFELVSSMAVVVWLVGLVQIALHPGLRAPSRLALPLVGIVTAIGGGVGLLFRLPPAWSEPLYTSLSFFALLSFVALLPQPANRRVRRGAAGLLLVMTVRALLRAGALNSGWLHDVADLEWVAPLGQLVMAASVVLLCPAPMWRRTPTMVAAALTSLLGAAAFFHPDAAQRMAMQLAGVEWPIEPYARVILLAAFGTYLSALQACLDVPGAPRLRGWGLALFGLGGFVMQLPMQVLLAGVGVLCIVEGTLRPDEAPLDDAAFAEMLKRGAAAVGAVGIHVRGPRGFELALFDLGRVAVYVQRRAGVVRRIDVSIGDEPAREPHFTLERRGAPRLGPRADGPRAESGDVDFDLQFVQRDRRDVGARLLDDATRESMTGAIWGWLGVWPERAVSYRAEQLPKDADALATLLLCLSGLAQRAGLVRS